MDWLAVARAHFSQTNAERTDETRKTPVSSVLSVPSDLICEKHDVHEEPAVDWRPLAQEYRAHHFRCPTCIAAGITGGLRCGTGAALWSAYTSAT